MDAQHCPTVLLVPARRDDDAGYHRVVPVTLRVPLSIEVADLARRMVTRAVGSRLDPAVCVDPTGRALGLVRVERLLVRLAELKSA